VELLKEWFKKIFGDNPKASNTIGRIVNKKHCNRIKSLLNEPKVKESVVFGGSMDEDDL
jgi:aldehyde dehydrogenase (NAD+)